MTRASPSLPESVPATELTWRTGPDAVDLFLFSAAVGLSHRIHYDIDFARSEGLDGLPVHGPLQAAYLSQLVSRWARQQSGRLSAMMIRHRKPVLAGQELACRATLVEVEELDDASRGHWVLELSVDGTVCTDGTAETLVPRDQPGGLSEDNR